MDQTERENQNIEIRLLLEAIWLRYGYDFRNYAPAHLKRRILHHLAVSGTKNISEMQHRVIRDRPFFGALLSALSINVTDVFRDPAFYLTVRREVGPVLATWPFFKIWHAGCATGEEVYSMAILLKEEGLYEKSQIYATDFDEQALRKARQGIYPIDRINAYTSNYQRAGGRHSFADYYTARYDSILFEQSLRRQIIFADHNLVTDGVFGEMNMIVCRNVLIYFDKDLQHRVIRLFADSLVPGGFLCIGPKETLRFSECSDRFETVGEQEKIYKKRLQM
ncbi:chemotaxis protein CheR [Desulfonema ishimotonii]|uniref:Chemotaxis protein CheR n=1 Tax=Desulfonema ishimotonii TaxID=45657 RepID=A0A401FV58_9BACT|nr:protein-glutamate O-methyltransferase CheR [Desulfonema ishimotonii]GBC60838.1 chemotaxis protein CheR [Desulfonema ishimotonii]